MCSLFRWEGAVKTLLRWRGATSSDLMQLGLIDGQHVAVREREERAKKSRTDRKKANREIKTQQTLAPAVFSCCAAVPRCDKLWFCRLLSADTFGWWFNISEAQTNQGPPVQTSVCCGESALSSASIHEKYHERRLQLVLLQEGEKADPVL